MIYDGNWMNFNKSGQFLNNFHQFWYLIADLRWKLVDLDIKNKLELN